MVRGARPTSTQFITDGMKSRTGDIGIPGIAVGSVKVYTSGIPAEYGDVTGGVIVVETKSYFDLIQQYK
jgi:outer membrane receptor protein involved in Fe transport